MRPLFLGLVLASVAILGGAVLGLKLSGVPGVPSIPGIGASSAPSRSPQASVAGADSTAVTAGTWRVVSPSWIGYSIGETTFLGTSTVSGKTVGVGGSGVLSAAAGGFSLSDSSFSADLTKLSSGDPFGDQQVQTALGTAQNPTATFNQTDSVSLPATARLKAGTSISIPGRISLRGQSHDVTVPAKVTFTNGRLMLVGSIPFKLSSFGIDASALGGLVTLSDAASLNLSLVLTRP